MRKKKKIVGSDVKSFFNEDGFKTDDKNEPRFFANSAYIDKDGVTFQKGIFTTCQNREENAHHGLYNQKNNSQ